jgi:acyl-CoA synthetase (NDP forming)
MSQLFSLARLFSNTKFENLKPIEDRKFVIVTNAGGPGIIATDAFETYGLTMARPNEKIKDLLKTKLPREAAFNNPIDVIGDAPPQRYADSIDVCFQDPEIHGALVLVTPQAQTRPLEVAQLCVEV